MTQSFKCPECNAPLKFQKGLVLMCKFCGSDVIIPAGIANPKTAEEEEISETKPLAETELLRDASDLGQKALKIAEIKHALKGNRTTSAAILFRDSFGGSLADARDIIKAIESGESVNLPDLKPDKAPQESDKSSPKWISLIVYSAIVIILFLLLMYSRSFFN